MSRSSNRVAALVLAGAVASLAAGCSGGGGDGGNAAPKISVDPTTVTFTQPFVGKTYTKTFSIVNTGNAALNVTGISLVDGSPNQDFLSMTHPALPFVVLAGTPETVTLTLQAKSEAPVSGTISIASNDPASPNLSVPITATSVDNAALKQCVLVGTEIIDGCDHLPDDVNAPAANLGTIARGAAASKVVLLWNDGPGNVPVAVSAVAFEPPQTDPSNYTVTLFTKSGADEVPVTLPFFLNPPDAADGSPRAELRARITFTANVAEGQVSGVSLKVDTSHPAGSLSIPVAVQVGGCPVGTADCDGNVANGCEVNTTNDLANCGGCGTVCGNAHASPQCTNGSCVLTCATDGTGTYRDCDGQSANGCETNISNNTSNCGGCGNVCSATHATPTCVTGACGILSCQTGWADCDINVNTGCETSITQVDRCGSCTNNCAAFNVAFAATYACNSAPGGAGPWECGVGTCVGGHTDMDESFPNGCECADEGYSDTCGSPFNTIDYGISGPNTVTGFITPLTDVDFIRVNFVSDQLCPDFSPQINVNDPTNTIVFDISTDGCAAPMTCGTGAPTALRDFATSYATCGLAGNSTYQAVGSIGRSYVIKVYTIASTSSTCMPYTITVQN